MHAPKQKELLKPPSWQRSLNGMPASASLLKSMLCSSVNLLLDTSVMLSVVDGLRQPQLGTGDAGQGSSRWQELRSSVV